jgi:carboxyl-terminal processing protease
MDNHQTHRTTPHSESRVWRAVNVLAAILTIFVLISPVFAQTAQDRNNPERAKARQYIELIGNVFEFVQQNYVDEVDPATLYQGALKGMLDALGDPHTSYLATEQMRGLTDTTSGKFGGVGLSISKLFVSTPENPAYIEVASPIDDTPGQRAGILAGDLIVSIDGTPTPDLTLDQAVSMLRGKVGTTVNIVVRRGKNIEFPVTLTRAIIELPTVRFGMIDNFGYLRIIEFTPNTAQRVQDALSSFEAAKFKGLIIDLRNNPGGLITSVADVADKFIDSGMIVTTKGRSEMDTPFIASRNKTTMPRNIPIIVLINKGSASASEILAGALKDYHLAYLVGEKTYGKGSVQQPVPLPNNDGMKITIARYYTPSDSNIDKVGIPPDREIAYPQYSEAEEKTYSQLASDGVIRAYTESHPDMTEAQISAYAGELKKKYNLDLRLLRRLVRLEATRTKPSALYDLDWDIQLAEALKILRTENFQSLMSATKTLKQLQEEAEKTVAKNGAK